MGNINLEWNEARHIADKIKKEKEENQSALRESIKSMYLEDCSAMDINILASEAGVTPNWVRRNMIHDDDPDKDFFDELESFRDDELDSIIDYF